MTTNELRSTDLGLVFKNVSISTLVPPKAVISNLSGFVKKGISKVALVGK